MRTIFSLLIALLCLAANPTTILAQNQPAKKSNTARPSIDAVYKIRLGAYAKMDAQQLSAAETKLKDLGQVSASGEGALTRLELGNYLGKSTANKVVAEAKKRGYKDAYAVKFAEFSNAMGEPLTHTFQFSAVKTLRVAKLVDALKTAALPDNSLFVHHSNGFYHLSVGLFNLGMTSHEAAYDAFATEQGFKEGFAKTVSKSNGFVAPRPEPKPEPKEEEKPKEEPKPAPKPDDKKDKMNGNKDANGNSTTTQDKRDKMNGNKDANGNSTTAQDKKDKMNRGAADSSKTNPAPAPNSTDSKKDKMRGKNVVPPVDSNKTAVKP